MQSTVEKFLRYYESHEKRPIFESVEEMLKWAGLYNLTTTSLGLKLADVGLSPLLIQELVTVRAFYFLIGFIDVIYVLFMKKVLLLTCLVLNYGTSVMKCRNGDKRVLL